MSTNAYCLLIDWPNIGSVLSNASTLVDSKPKCLIVSCFSFSLSLLCQAATLTAFGLEGGKW